MSFADLVMENFRFFRENMLPYYIIIPTKNDRSLIIRVEASNLLHLLGANKSTNIKLKSMSGTDFYNMLEEIDDPKDLPDFLNQQDVDRFENGDELAMEVEDKKIYWKNKAFIDTFKSLLIDKDIRIFTKNSMSDLDTDYAQRFDYKSGKYDNYSYACFIGNTDDKYYSFNSVVVYPKNARSNDSFKGRFIVTGPIQLVEKEKFSPSNYKVWKSDRNKYDKRRVAKPFKPDWHEIGKRLSKLAVFNGYYIDVGILGKNSIQIVDSRSNEIVEGHFEKNLRKCCTDQELKAFKTKEFAGKVASIIRSLEETQRD